MVNSAGAALDDGVTAGHLEAVQGLTLKVRAGVPGHDLIKSAPFGSSPV